MTPGAGPAGGTPRPKWKSWCLTWPSPEPGGEPSIYLKEIESALQAGRLDLVDRALNNYLYDKQLYALKRIQRTETSNAYQLAQIRATEDDPEIIGYQWILSSSHPQPDICDWYASVGPRPGKRGLAQGKGAKEKGPSAMFVRPVAHDQPGKGRGGPRAWTSSWKRTPKRPALKPQWAKDMQAAGAPTSALTGDDGWFNTKKEVEKRLGDKATAGEGYRARPPKRGSGPSLISTQVRE